MSSSNCCFLTCIQVSQEADQVVCYSHFFQNFPQFIVIHTVKGFVIVNKAEIDVFLELSCFFQDPANVGNLISGSSAFCKTSMNIWKFTVCVLLRVRQLIIHGAIICSINMVITGSSKGISQLQIPLSRRRIPPKEIAATPKTLQLIL